MARIHPTPPNPPEGGARQRDSVAQADARADAATDNLGNDDAVDMLDLALDDQAGDDGSHRSFADDVRSDSNDDEKHERR